MAKPFLVSLFSYNMNKEVCVCIEAAPRVLRAVLYIIAFYLEWSCAYGSIDFGNNINVSNSNSNMLKGCSWDNHF